jgi:hypothetical protein
MRTYSEAVDGLAMAYPMSGSEGRDEGNVDESEEEAEVHLDVRIPGMILCEHGGRAGARMAVYA